MELLNEKEKPASDIVIANMCLSLYLFQQFFF